MMNLQNLLESWFHATTFFLPVIVENQASTIIFYRLTRNRTGSGLCCGTACVTTAATRSSRETNEDVRERGFRRTSGFAA